MRRLPVIVTAAVLLAAPMESVAQVEVSIEETREEESVSKQTPAPEEESRADVASKPEAAKTYEGLLSLGHDAFLSGRHAGALDRYEEAKDMEPGRADAYYFIGYAQGRLGRFDEAFVTLQTARTVAGNKNTDLSAKVLFLRAVLQEQRGDLQAAEKAWTDYLGFAQTHTGARVFIESAQSRLDAIKKMQRLDEQYAEVRKRLEE